MIDDSRMGRADLKVVQEYKTMTEGERESENHGREVRRDKTQRERSIKDNVVIE